MGHDSVGGLAHNWSTGHDADTQKIHSDGGLYGGVFLDADGRIWADLGGELRGCLSGGELYCELERLDRSALDLLFIVVS